MKDTRDRRCTVERSDHSFCDAPSVEWAPFPICAHHARELYTAAHGLIQSTYGKLSTHLDREGKQVLRAHTDRQDSSENAAIVYYVGVRDLVKIGYSHDIRTRMRGYPPGSVLLASEPGGRMVETWRLRQFAHLLEHGNEWFRKGPDLMRHIDTLRTTA